MVVVIHNSYYLKNDASTLQRGHEGEIRLTANCAVMVNKSMNACIDCASIAKTDVNFPKCPHIHWFIACSCICTVFDFVVVVVILMLVMQLLRSTFTLQPCEIQFRTQFRKTVFNWFACEIKFFLFSFINFLECAF